MVKRKAIAMRAINRPAIPNVTEWDATQLQCATPDMGQVWAMIDVLATSRLTVADLCALDVADLDCGSRASGGQVAIGSLLRRGGDSQMITLMTNTVDALDLCRPHEEPTGGPLFRLPFALGDDGRVSGYTRMTVPVVTYFLATAGMHADIDVRPLLARGVLPEAVS